jgi:hypothetical protein
MAAGLPPMINIVSVFLSSVVAVAVLLLMILAAHSRRTFRSLWMPPKLAIRSQQEHWIHTGRFGESNLLPPASHIWLISGLSAGAALDVSNRVERENGVGIGATCRISAATHGFHNLFGRGAFLQGRFCMPTDAIRTLRDVSYCYGDQLLGLRGECPLGEHTLTESLEGLSRFWSQVLALFYQFLGR